MHSLKCLSCLLLICLLAGADSCKKPGQHENCTVVNVNEAVNVQKIMFTTVNTGFACGGKKGESGAIYKTNDGGMSWGKVFSSGSLCIYDIAFLNDTLGYACGENLLIVNTIDGGLHWSTYVFTPDQLPPDAFRCPLRNLCCINPDTIYCCGGQNFENGISLKSFDRNHSWTYNTFEHELRGVTFLSKNVGLYSGYGAVFHSTDSASTFQQLPVTGDFYMSIAKLDNRSSVMCGYNGGIYKSTDSGQSWSSMLDHSSGITSSRHFNQVAFMDANTGYAVGNNGLILVTHDGGNSWSEILINTSDNLYSVNYKSGTEVFITGQNGNIYHLTP
jgi:photosystem II stability/assembly factor-like uncharacterized protein